MRRSRLLLPCLLVACWVAGCSSTGRNNSGEIFGANSVTHAFSVAGIRLLHLNTTDGIDVYINARLSPKDPWIEVEIFPTLRSAKLAKTSGGNITNSDGSVIHPLAVVRNVVITRFETATPIQRARALSAVRLLRRQD